MTSTKPTSNPEILARRCWSELYDQKKRQGLSDRRLLSLLKSDYPDIAPSSHGAINQWFTKRKTLPSKELLLALVTVLKLDPDHWSARWEEWHRADTAARQGQNGQLDHLEDTGSDAAQTAPTLADVVSADITVPQAPDSAPSAAAPDQATAGDDERLRPTGSSGEAGLVPRVIVVDPAEAGSTPQSAGNDRAREPAGPPPPPVLAAGPVPHVVAGVVGPAPRPTGLWTVAGRRAGVVGGILFLVAGLVAGTVWITKLLDEPQRQCATVTDREGAEVYLELGGTSVKTKRFGEQVEINQAAKPTTTDDGTYLPVRVRQPLDPPFEQIPLPTNGWMPQNRLTSSTCNP
jgi:hypothetical protein